MLTYQAVHAPQYMTDLLSRCQPTRSLSSSVALLLPAPQSRLTSFWGRAFQHAATRLWNVLSISIRSANNLNSFKKALKKSSVCAISMQYRKMILIIIIISLGKILLSYIANTSRTHARTHAHTHARAHTHSRTQQPTTIAILAVAVRWVGAPNHDKVNASYSPSLNGR